MNLYEAVTCSSTFKDYVNHIVVACNFHIWGVCNTLQSISCDVANTMAAYIVGTCFDCYNSLLDHVHGTKSLNKSQRVQNKLARVICNITIRQLHTVDLIHNRHWLPIRSHIMFKIATLCFKAYRLNQTNYLQAASHIGAIYTMSWIKIFCYGLADSTKDEYQNRCMSFLFYGASLEWTSIGHP